MKHRILAFLLSAVMLAGLLTGCGGKESAADPTQQNQTTGGKQTEAEPLVQTKYVYQAEFLTLNVDPSYQINYVQSYCISGKSLFFCTSCVTGTAPLLDEATGEAVLDENGEPIENDVYEDLIFRMDLDTQETTRLDSFAAMEIPEDMEGYRNINSMTAGSDGTVWVLEQLSTYSYDLPENFDSENDEIWNYYVPGESRSMLHQLDASGQEVKAVELSVQEEFYPQEMRMDASGNIYISSNSQILLFDTNGELLAELGDGSDYFELYQLSENEIAAAVWGENGRVLKLVDPAAKDFGEELPLISNASRIYPGVEDYQYLYDDYGDVVYGYNAETGEGEKLFSWLDCSVNSNQIEAFTVLPDGRIVTVAENYVHSGDGGNWNYEVVLLHPVDAASLPQVKTLTLACMYLDSQIRTAVLDFNKSHNDIHIAVRDYSEYNTEEDYTAGLTKLNTEILSGAVPDILCTYGLPIDQYAGKGLLVDLWPLIDGDGALSRDDLMTHFFDVLSIDGKLYQVTDGFQLQTAAGNAQVVGDRIGWTLEELLESLGNLEDGASIFGESDTKSDILNACVSRSYEDFIDWQNMSCSFDSPEFIELLTFANSFPAEFDWSNYDWETAESEYSRMISGKQLLVQAYIGEFAYLQVISAEVGGDPAFPGYPSASGRSGSCFSLNTGLSITSGCSDMDAAWEFVRTILTQEYQTNDDTWAFPTNRHAFEALAEEAMTPEYETDPETGEQVEVSHHSWGIGNDLVIDVMAMTQEEYDTFMELYNACDSIYSSNDQVTAIIQEEAAFFFAGQKTAEETARLIQDRVSIYVNEQG